jgi:hypothetical protein
MEFIRTYEVILEVDPIALQITFFSKRTINMNFNVECLNFKGCDASLFFD